MTNKFISKFLCCESGAATVDMAVVMAGVVGLAIATTAAVQPGVNDLGEYVETQLTDMMDTPIELTLLSLLTASYDESWRSALAQRAAGFNDNRLVRAYNNTYRRATTGTVNRRARQIDRLSVFEAEMLARGTALPDTNESYAALHAAWVAENA